MKGQLKIQEMAFVLIALVVFFALLGLFLVKWRSGSLQEAAGDSREAATQQLLLVLANTPELGLSGCTNCIDLDKALVVQEQEAASKMYSQLWKLDYLALKRVYPEKNESECSLTNYPDCDTLTIVPGDNFGTSSRVYVSLCRRDAEKNQEICELGEAYASGTGVTYAQ